MNFTYFDYKLNGPLFQIVSKHEKQKPVTINLKRILYVEVKHNLIPKVKVFLVHVARKQEKIEQSKTRHGNCSSFATLQILCENDNEVYELRNLIHESHKQVTNCCCSSGIHEGITIGYGELDNNGYWEHGCYYCAREKEYEFPQFYPIWPFSEDYYKEKGQFILAHNIALKEMEDKNDNR